ncbi:MAG: hypothetical protein ACYDH6_24465 [Acidimicrobiales bacterium]
MAAPGQPPTLAELEEQRARLTRRLLDPLPARMRNDAWSLLQIIADGRGRDRTIAPPPGPLSPTWVAANDGLISRWLDAAAQLDARRRTLVQEAVAERPAYLVERIGPVPDDRRARQAWERAAAAVETYRDRHGVDGRDALGPQPPDGPARREWGAASREMDRVARHLRRDGPELGR